MGFGLYLFMKQPYDVHTRMSTDRTHILLNVGTKTRKAFVAGLNGAPYRRYKTKRIMLHIEKSGEVHFLSRNNRINFTNTSVFTRLRATDQHFCGMLNEYFAHHGIEANDPIQLSYPNSAEKISQMLLLALKDIPIPESYIFREESFEANREYIASHLAFPAVFKIDGSQGKNVQIVHSFTELERAVAQKPRYLLALVQPFIENTFDTRTLVAYGEVLGSISRTRTKGYLNNIAQGAIPERYELTDAEKKIAVRAAQVCRIDFGGVDMIHTDEGPVVLEVNKSPQIAGFESVHDFKVFTKLAEIMAGR